MRANMLVREITRSLGTEARNLFADFGVVVDEWELDLSLAELCDEYGLDTGEILSMLQEISRRLNPDEHEDEDDIEVEVEDHDDDEELDDDDFEDEEEEFFAASDEMEARVGL